MLDPGGISNWSVTYVDWSERRWHPKTYRARDISLKFLKNITVMSPTTLFSTHLLNIWYILKIQFLSFVSSLSDIYFPSLVSCSPTTWACTWQALARYVAWFYRIWKHSKCVICFLFFIILLSVEMSCIGLVHGMELDVHVTYSRGSSTQIL